VKKGDTLIKIAKRHKMKLWVLRRLNGNKLKANNLRVGKKIWVIIEGPSPRGVRGYFQLTSGHGYHVRNPKRAWGTFLTVSSLIDVFAAYRRKFPQAPPIRVDDISVKGGGFLRPHKSHRRGRDVDIRYPLKKDTKRYVKATSKRLNLKLTWKLIDLFLKTNDVIYIFMDYGLQRALYKYALSQKYSKRKLQKIFQYPRSRKMAVGIIRHEPGHTTHFHVRFRRKPSKAPNI
jgi:murein endopeptidase